MDNCLSIYYQNCRGIRTKLHTVYINILSHKYDIIILTETWLHPSILDNEFIDKRYCVYRCDRDRVSTGRRDGGGVLVAVLRELCAVPSLPPPATVACPPPMPVVDHMTVQLRGRNGVITLISAVYIPPNQHINVYSSYLEYVKQLIYYSNAQRFCLVGDYNLPTLDWHCDGSGLQPLLTNKSSAIDKEVITFSARMNCIQLNSLRNNNNKILDLCFTNITECRMLPSPVSLVPLDDHHPSFYILSPFYYNIRCIPTKTQSQYCFKNADYTFINGELSKIDWGNSFKNKTAESAMNTFYEIIYGLIRKHVPTKILKSSHFPPWFTSSLIHIYKNKDRAWIKWKKYSNISDYEIFSLYRKRFKRESHDCYKKYLNRVESGIEDNVKYFWTFISNRKNADDIPSTVFYNDKFTDNPKEACNLFSKYFQSVFEPSLVPDSFNIDDIDININPCNSNDLIINNVTFTRGQVLKELQGLDISKGAGTDHIPAVFLKHTANTLHTPLHFLFNKCIHEGICPNVFKSARIVPVYKGGRRENVTNYRPISILPAMSKLFEKLIHNDIYPSIHHTIIPQQHGFVQRRSTTTNLIDYTTYLFETIDNNKQTDSIYTDFQKAFDRVDHKLLLEKIAFNGIRGNLWRWLKSYVSNRTQRVAINGYESDVVAVTSGVPQGSILGPLLFNLFINDISSCFKFCKILLYADDLKIYHIIHSPTDHLLIQKDLDRFSSYCKANKLSLNLNKCKSVTFSRKRNVSMFQYSLCDSVLETVQSIKDLGVTLDAKLILDTHIDNVVNKAYKMYGFIMRSTVNFQRPSTYLYLYKCLIRPQLEYAVTVWNPHFNIYVNKIEMVQKKFLRRLQYKFFHNRLTYSQLLNKYKLIDLKSRRTQLEIMFLYDLVHNRYDCSSLTNILCYRVPRRTQYRSSRKLELFAINSSRTIAGTRSPLNRIVKKYNVEFNNIDMFATRPLAFKKMITETLSIVS